MSDELPQDPAERARVVVERLAAVLVEDPEVSVQEDADAVHISVEGEDVGRFIGRHGQVIDAVQHLAYRAVSMDRPADRRVLVDAEGYRERRAEALRSQADRAADEAVSDDKSVSLPSMSAIERRIVHEYLRDRHEVETHSEGEEPDRHLVVSPVVD
jgi:spoIIIJ-associated protein